MSAVFAFAVGLLGGCYEVPGLPPMADEPATVVVDVGARVAVDAVAPSDVRVLPGREVVVLDGLQRRLWVMPWPEGAAPASFVAVALPPGADLPVRLAPSMDGGVWLVGPNTPLRRIDLLGAVVETLPVVAGAAPLRPVSALERGGELWLAEGNTVRVVSRETGETRVVKEVPADEGDWARVVDLIEGPTGDVLGVDTLGARMLTLDDQADSAPLLGVYGRWAGTLSHPKSAAVLDPHAVVVTDTDLDALQLFSLESGDLVGILAESSPTGAAPLRPVHPIAVRAGADRDSIVVLDADPSGAHVLFIDVPEESRELAWSRMGVRHLRYALGDERDVASPETCRQCHDGLVMDGRGTLDPSATHHPVGEDLPDPVACGDCHTPHGAEGLESFLRHGLAEDALCVGCHEGEAHKPSGASEAGRAGTHLTGSALREQLEASSTGEDAGCLACHDVHDAGGPSLTRASSDETACVRCHEAQATGGHVHGEVQPCEASSGSAPCSPACQTCHALVDGKGESLLRSVDLCVECHDPVAHGGGKRHGGRTSKGKSKVDCVDCHDVHEPKHQATLLRTSGTEASCKSCHKTPTAGHPVAPGAGKLPACADCHPPHTPRARPTCGSCHEEHASAGGHGAAACLDCHPAHHAAKKASGHPREAACLTCHGPSAKPGLNIAHWTHPAPLFESSGPAWDRLQGLPLFAADGEQVPAGAPGALVCASCHLTHGSNLDNLRRPGWTPMCASCHGPDALGLYMGFHRSRSKP